MEGTTIDWDGGTASIGLPVQNYMDVFKSFSTYRQTSALFELTSSVEEDPRETSVVYASSWLLYHYLEDEQREAFHAFEADLTKLIDWREAWAKHFPGLTPEAVDTLVSDYAKRHQMLHVSGDVQLPQFEIEPRALTAAEAHGIKAWTAARLSNRELAKEEAQLALAQDPSELSALKTIFESASNAEERIAIAQRAVAKHPDQATAWLLLLGSEAPVADRTRAFEQAARLAPDHPAVRLAKAEMALESKVPEDALESAMVAVRRAAPTPRVLATLIRSLAHGVGCTEAADGYRAAAATLSSKCQTADSQLGGTPTAPIACSAALKQALLKACPRAL
jgi:tetratricopeptide (TPR) repeat protein